MTNRNDPIQPLSWKERPDGVPQLNTDNNGLSKIEYFAAMAMQGMLANSIDNQQGIEPFWHMGNIRLAESAVLMADALINALNEKP